jgi:aldose 1-epimerase
MPDNQIFGHLPDGRAVERVTLRGGGLTAHVLTLGAIVQDLRLDGIAHPLVLGGETLDPYLGPMNYFGAIVGRFANRIGHARVHLDGRDWALDRNWRGRHILHGGAHGTSAQVWQITALAADQVTLGLTLPDGHMGFPGKMQVAATIALDPDCALRITVTATTDRATPCSFAHHGYFALDGSGTLDHHKLQIHADHTTAIDDDLIPTGALDPVAGTELDFRTPRAIGRLPVDHNFCLTDGPQPMRAVTHLSTPTLSMTIETAEPGLQVFTAPNLPPDGLPGLDGRLYRPFAGIALEAQAWPDAPNQPHFPPAILHPDDTYHRTTRYKFTKGAKE